MKIIVEKSTNVVKFLLENTDEVALTATTLHLITANTIVPHFNSNNVKLIENVESPEDFKVNKYKYINGAYQLISNWEPPIQSNS